MAGAALALTAGAASAQTWMSINERQRMLDDRIDAGVRTGDLSRVEAQRLRSEFRDIRDLEARYRLNGLSPSEMADLDSRFDRLAVRVRLERNDWQRRGDRVAGNDDWGRWFGGANWRDDRGRWVSIDRRQAQLERRIDLIERGREGPGPAPAEAEQELAWPAAHAARAAPGRV